ncbi:Zinc finger C2H2 [Penicillium concentricum]|uniref:Zinc finger C2H2 n=1 Tax=Penicillium concentricum TaxID=293559 RepID=A0A9W9V953_9EURO|nr:Zinc finger C2H2 [Penicillium concentricum]KAJ5373377.1 Zinc finger C2H2 [Penicillium concentricum]
MNTAPPPLPPPPRIPDLEMGYDAGWQHANLQTPTSLPPINPSSSLFGGRRPETASQGDPMQIDDLEGRQGGAPLSRSPETQIQIQPPLPATDGFPNSMSVIPNPAGPILSGERQFSLRSVKDSSNAYDQHLLSKIGKPQIAKPPSPGGSISLGTDNRNSLPALTVPSRSPSNLPSPGPSEGSTLDVKWHNSPQSGGVSPRTKVGWREYVGRSPSVESNAPSSALDYDQGSLRDVSRRRYRGTTPQREDSISLPSRSNRGSYDQGVFSDIEGEFSTDEPAPPRQFILREPTPPYPDSRHGMKRRASSPPREPISDDRHTLHVATSNGDLSQRRLSGHPFTNTLSVNPNYATSQRTFSAGSSLSIRTSGSYSSTLSIGGSSMTSLSPYDRPSPGGFSPSSDLDTFHEKSILNPSPTAALSQPSLPRIPGPASLEPPATDATGKMSVPTTIMNVPKPAAPKIGGLFICDCCPKKPKKFDNPDGLRAHEMEKQYACAYCNHRFKNKNEAERHQNSLHLRRHSWSCAALVSFQAAFHASGTQSCQTNAGPTHDTCGYCGEEFPNFPQADWDQRFEHLTTVHKFGECNNAKKFFRADHFRQHLKHSHAGTSGKWTNILENACMKEEQPPEPREPRGPRDKTASGSQTGGSLTSNAISEVLSEQ